MDDRTKVQFLMELNALLADWFPRGFHYVDHTLEEDDNDGSTVIKGLVINQGNTESATLTISFD